jgi:hypothetical protein
MFYELMNDPGYFIAGGGLSADDNDGNSEEEHANRSITLVSENGQSEQQQQQNETKDGMAMDGGAARWFAMAFFLYSAAAMLSFKIEQSTFRIV